MKEILAFFRRLFKMHSADMELHEYSREVREAIRKKNDDMYLLIDIFRCSQMNR